MGEYAIRKSDHEQIKIGTCSDMYYIRYEDRDKVTPLHNNIDIAREPENLRFRLPFPDEDDLRPGDYEKHDRALRLYRRVESRTTAPDAYENFTDGETVTQPGTIQLHHNSGLLINVRCYHGNKLPDATPEMKAFWNGGIGHFLVLSSLRTVKVEDGNIEVWPVVRCVHCNEAWRKQWAEIWDYIEPSMQKRLEKYRPR